MCHNIREKKSILYRIRCESLHALSLKMNHFRNGREFYCCHFNELLFYFGYFNEINIEIGFNEMVDIGFSRCLPQFYTYDPQIFTYISRSWFDKIKSKSVHN